MGSKADLVNGNVSNPSRPLLVVCDFDHTLINVNSDLVLFHELPYGQSLIPSFVSLRKEQGLGWTQTMQAQLAALAEQDGYSKGDMLECLGRVKMDPVLLAALEKLHKNQAPKVKFVIASDANTIFIDEILRANGVEKDTFSKIYTNPGMWAEHDVLRVEPYQSIDAPHECLRACPPNMCKSSILRRAVKELKLEDATDLRAVYVGDGGNDFCPALELSETDLVLVREGFALQKLIDKAAIEASTDPESPAESDKQSDTKSVKAQIKLWNTQEELGQLLVQLVGGDAPVPVSSPTQDQVETAVQQLEHDLAAKATIGDGPHL
ncbi:uncharacterized protein HMPREF1541_01558 [Cyphellophora europaea CBS 101466]|uniref:2,3-diketo-5-methylthio-1-phosphopentane phosphatase n=1 Tax=Cyphellophora europaea (strain CBS 101466) TaxID=1220924 RepID=W2S3A2_CYPE1|nr:uncharacterized protein HMPREF1541_01558 [Cyphellophora europaea CBS 101466]ETN42404.1 hypothetical protein HMPREF1541_01558 [Cyphellophora europaea CBS 101466]